MNSITINIFTLIVNQVHFDGWEMDFDYWTSPNSPYIHPLGWCEQNGVKLNPPKGKNLVLISFESVFCLFEFDRWFC